MTDIKTVGFDYYSVRWTHEKIPINQSAKINGAVAVEATSPALQFLPAMIEMDRSWENFKKHRQIMRKP